MMKMSRVMCVLAVVLCCACGYTMAAAAAVDNDSPSGRGVSRGAVEVSCGAGGALRVRPAAESEWLTCGAGSRVSACGKYADLCRHRTARTTTTTTTTTNGQPKAVMALLGDYWSDFGEFPSGSDTDSRQSSGGSENGNGKQGGPGKQVTNKKLEGELSVVPHAGRESLAQKDSEGAEEHTGGNKANTIGDVQLPSGGETDDQTSDQLSEKSNHVEPTSSSANNPSVSHSERDDSSSSTTISTPAQDVPAPSVTTTATVTSPQNVGEGAAAEESTAKGSEPSATTLSANTNTASSESHGQTREGGPNDATEQSSSSSTNSVTEAATPSTSPPPNPEITYIASAVQKTKANVDSSSVCPVWMRTAAPLLIVAVLFSVTVY
ncbi:uncharacterized protein TM35_000731160 [Trypanosoma theileri]|uniref:Mucin-associated surface protein (MASP) n=1 Tax=Trypanosoma theileri TaxID=67003 RepID=A0A1X0NF99_9TRYP|nr:uncharacterized protein TM35_000731160 [Trypanosoma theileri]ORC83392.1 hypothetical protein TM35_000731160 [Trypanosoma theileri]